MKTLLEKAKAAKKPQSKKGSKIGNEEIDLSLAWARDEITYTQVLEALSGGRNGSAQAYIVLARGLREAFRTKKVR